MAATPVRIMGFARTLAELMTASRKGVPAVTCIFIKSTNKIEFLTIIPAKAIMPIIEVAVNCAPAIQ